LTFLFFLPFNSFFPRPKLFRCCFDFHFLSPVLFVGWLVGLLLRPTVNNLNHLLVQLHRLKAEADHLLDANEPKSRAYPSK